MSKPQNQGLKRRLREADPSERPAIIDGLPYDVGFGKTPKHTRFSSDWQPARRGRSKGSENLATIVREEAAERVEVSENGKRRRRSKQRIAVTQVFNKAAGGDLKAVAQMVDLIRKTEPQQPAESAQPVIDQRDVETFERIVKAFSGSKKTDGDPEDRGQS